MEQSHDYIMFNKNIGCTGIKMEEFHQNFNGTVSKILNIYGIRKEVHGEMISSLSASSDSSQMNESRRNANPHLTSIKFSKEFIDEISARLMDMQDVSTLISKQRKELEYVKSL